MSHWESTGKSNEWYTPKYVFDALECRFDLDVAAPDSLEFCSVPATNFITSGSLQKDWHGFVWCNPPFGGRNHISVWLNKMIAHGNGIFLTPDRTSAAWWQGAAKCSNGMLFVAGKIKFVKPDGTTSGFA